WPLEADDGGKVLDLSGRGNHATLRGGRIAKGAVGNGLSFSGQQGEYCDLGQSTDLNFPAKGSFTIARWFHTTVASGTILAFRSTQNGSQIDLLIREAKLIVVVGDDLDPGPQNAFVWGGRLAADGQWHHFAFTRTGDDIELFLDGESQGTKRAPNSGGSITTNL